MLSRSQSEMISAYLRGRRNGLRNQLMFLLSVRAGLRAKEIASLQWMMVLGADGEVGASICLTDAASKGQSGRTIPLSRALRSCLVEHFHVERVRRDFGPRSFIVRSERSARMAPQVVVNAFQSWYRDLGLIGCSSHSGRRTFITNAARSISRVGGSIRDVQLMAGHKSLQTTQRYIDGNAAAAARVVDII